MSLADDLGDLGSVPTIPSPPWTPGADWDGNGGEVRTAAYTTDTAPAWDDVLAHFGLDPAEFAVVEPVRISVWDAQTKTGIQQLRAYRARVVRRRPQNPLDVDEIITTIKRHKRRTKVPTGTEALVVVLGDWQMGKPDGDGSAGTVSRVLDAIDAVTDRVKALRRTGRSLGELAVLGVGDMLEGCAGWYSYQPHAIELDRREQTRIVRRLLVKALTAWAPLFETVTVASVGGNHGENREGGKIVTGYNDNDDLAVFEQAAEILAANDDAYGHVRFAIGGHPLTKTVEVAGRRIAMTHGHLARDSGNVEAKLRGWYQRQVAGQELAPVDLLVTGHYHHLRVANWGPTTWLQCPAMDGGSVWHASIAGDDSPAGLLTFTTGAEPVNDIHIIHGRRRNG